MSYDEFYGAKIAPQGTKPKGSGNIRCFLWGFGTCTVIIWYVWTMLEILKHAYN